MALGRNMDFTIKGTMYRATIRYFNKPFLFGISQLPLKGDVTFKLLYLPRLGFTATAVLCVDA
jgi:hypothetical protein